MVKIKPRVLVAMSGGVDSSVAALLLQEQGYEVAGATMRLWTSAAATNAADDCPSLTTVADARHVARRLHIPFYVFDFSKAFREQVVAGFIKEYESGRTPNPCITCNRYFKFGLFLQKALALHFDYIATGHYVRRQCDTETGLCWLEKADDHHKDQSYALYNITEKQLRHTLFPLGDLTKEEVFAIARRHDLIRAGKAESQEICFIPDDDYRRFLTEEMGLKNPPGQIISQSGRVLGRHGGIHNFTIGQRRGIGLTHAEPLYVTAIRPETGQIVVGTTDEVWSQELLADDVNLVHWPTDAMAELTAKIRYNARDVACSVELLPEGRMRVIFKQPVRAATPGQAIVLYSGSKLVGGGTIQQII